jgi:hypothetical protein
MYSLIELNLCYFLKNLESNHITDKGICHLQGLAHLKYLNLRNKNLKIEKN